MAKKHDEWFDTRRSQIASDRAARKRVSKLRKGASSDAVHQVANLRKSKARKPIHVINSVFEEDLKNPDPSNQGRCKLSNKLRQILQYSGTRERDDRIEAVYAGDHHLLIGPVKDAFKRLLISCIRTKLIDPDRRMHPNFGRLAKNCPINALMNLSRFHEMWTRQPEDWKCPTKNVNKQFSLLSRHLLAKYEMPEFMDSVWLEGETPHALLKQKWFVNISQGENIRKQTGIPIELTKKMAHLVMQAPKNYTIDQAFRYGQILSLGGNERCVNGIIATRLREFNNAEDFWVTVIRFFIENPMLDIAQYGPIYDYIKNQRFDNQRIVIVDGRTQQIGPPQPNFSMKERTANILLEHVERWHSELGKRSRQVDIEWESCGIPGVEITEGKKDSRRCFVIEELLSSKALIDEGNAMRHCVGSYSRSCKSGKIAIYSLSGGTSTLERRLTIEVDVPTKRIVEARGKANANPTQLDKRVMGIWQSKVGISISSWL